MNFKDKKTWIIGGIALSYIVLFVIIIVLSVNLSNKGKHRNISVEDEERIRNIRLDEDISSDGIIENLEGVRWNNARIFQNNGQLNFSVTINNESKDKKVKKQTLKVILLDKYGNEIIAKDLEMKEISKDYGYTNIQFTAEMKELVIIDDIKIVATEKDIEDNSEGKDNKKEDSEIQNTTKEKNNQ